MKPISTGLRTWVWLASLAAAFVVTHVPPPARSVPPLVNDKLLHGLGFTALGFLTVWRLGGRGRPIGWGAAAAWLAGLALYAAVDERTQEWVGRSCEWGDWLADLVGAALGMTLGMLASGGRRVHS
jgi:VanZ family protein